MRGHLLIGGHRLLRQRLGLRHHHRLDLNLRHHRCLGRGRGFNHHLALFVLTGKQHRQENHRQGHQHQGADHPLLVCAIQ